MKVRIITLLIILSSLFSYAQKAKYEIISSWVQFYEFNSDRDKIYLFDYDKVLSVYDIDKRTTTIIDTGLNAETMYLKSSLFYSDGYMYFITEENILKIKDDKIIYKIPIIFYEYHYGAINSKTIALKKSKMKKLDKIISNYNDNDIQRYFKHMHKNPYISFVVLNYKDKTSVAFSAKRLRVGNYMDKENIKKIEKLQKVISFNRDSSFIRKKIKKRLFNYFENDKIIIEERTYSCRKESFMSLVSQCKYLMYINYNNKTYKLKDTKRDTRISFLNGTTVKGNLIKRLPNSRYITDKNGDIFLIFDYKCNLIKIPKNQFEK